MHLLLASVSSASSPTGVCRHAANIARGMLGHPDVGKVTMFAGEWQTSYFRDAFDLKDERLELRSVSIRNRSVMRNLWYLRGLPAEARACAADVIHLAFPMPVLRSVCAAPAVVSLHDLYPFDIPRNFGKSAGLNRAALALCLQNVDAIACVSEETRNRMHMLFPATPPEKAMVIPNSVCLAQGADAASLPSQIRGAPFLLCVAQHRANKNLPLLLRTFRLALDRNVVPANTRLVLVGRDGPETKLLHEVVEQCSLKDRIVFLHGISDALLCALYVRCTVTIAPSLMEGFGLPVAEALSAGSRVVCADIPAFRSIDSKRPLFFDPLDHSGESLIAALRRAIATPQRHAESSVGLEPRQTAAMYLDLYARLLTRNRSHAPRSDLAPATARKTP